MIESPLLQEIIAETWREAIVTFLTSRFGTEAGELEADLKAIENEDRLNELVEQAGSCRSLKSFRKLLKP